MYVYESIRYDLPQAVPAEQLPLKLPDMDDFKPGTDPQGEDQIYTQKVERGEAHRDEDRNRQQDTETLWVHRRGVTSRSSSRMVVCHSHWCV